MKQYTKVKKEFIPIPVIMDGQILNHNLKYLNLDRKWLMKKLNHKGKKPEEIVLATILKSGTLKIDSNNPHDGGKGPYDYKPGQDN
ncbi:DUF421 domain-containing protein [Priestia megaterium]|uniref:YetF domain-containing protein n=1 Tax=Priestia megaterium TaxID=1404 RepID=UPI002E1DBD83|nr:DUF421 domain-containing protein [Priestia megaterium]